MDRIAALGLANPASLEIQRPGETRAAVGFGQILRQAVDEVQQSRAAATEAVERLLSGEQVELHNALLAVQKAELTLELFIEVRNKILQAYQEIMRMQI